LTKPFSILIPVYNEAEIITENTEVLLDYLSQDYERFEIILGSNGSVDGTIMKGNDLENRFSQVRFFHIHRKGVGRAFKRGVRMAKYDRIISLDMDLSIDMGFIHRALELMDSGYDVVVGSKKMGHQRRTMFRRLGSSLFIFCARRLLDISFEDYSIAAKCYRRSLLLQYVDRIDHGTSYVIEILYMASRNGMKLIEIPVRCEDLRASKFNIIHEGVYRFTNLFRFWYGQKCNPR